MAGRPPALHFILCNVNSFVNFSAVLILHMFSACPYDIFLVIIPGFCYNPDCAGVSEWQTRKTQNLL